MKSLRYKTIPKGIKITNIAIAPVSGAKSGEISKNKKKLSVMAVMSKIAIVMKPIMYIKKYNCLSDKFINLFI